MDGDEVPAADGETTNTISTTIITVTEAVSKAVLLDEESDIPRYIAALIVSILAVVLTRWWDVIFKKSWIYTQAFLYMIISSDTKIKKYSVSPPSEVHSTVTVIFIRHSESFWNEIFNVPPKWMLPYRLVKALIQEMTMFADLQSSIFLDSPLNHVGIDQAYAVEKFITHEAKPEDKELLNKGIILSSPLRRALTTGILGFKARLKLGTKIRVLSCLQECSRNVDTQSLTPANTHPKPSSALVQRDKEGATSYRDNVDINDYDGNKTLSSNAGIRILQFCDKAFQLKGYGPAIIVAGHSIWFKSFFKMLIRKDTDSRIAQLAMNKKIHNGGLVKFTLRQHKAGSTFEYSVDPASINEIHLGFEKKGFGPKNA